MYAGGDGAGAVFVPADFEKRAGISDGGIEAGAGEQVSFFPAESVKCAVIFAFSIMKTMIQ